MKSIAWAIIIAAFIMMPEPRDPPSHGTASLVAFMFLGSWLGFFISLSRPIPSSHKGNADAS